MNEFIYLVNMKMKELSDLFLYTLSRALTARYQII